MANMQRYSNAFVFIEGRLLTQESSVKVSIKSGFNPVHTTHEGLAGASEGSSFIEIDVEEAVPSADFDTDPTAYMKTFTVVEVKIVAASKQGIFKCFMTESDFSHSVDSPAKMSFKFIGRLSDFE